jgi:UDP-N-acetylmuramate-alanine ligase
MDTTLKAAIKRHAAEGALVLLMSAGTLDEWARRELV